MPKRPSPRRRRRRRRSRRPFLRIGLLMLGAFAALAAGTLFFSYLQIQERFRQGLWQIPSKVYSDRVRLAPGTRLDPDDLEAILLDSGYQATDTPSGPGEFRRRGGRFVIHRRALEGPWGHLPPRTVHVTLRRGRVVGIHDARGATLSEVRLEPRVLATLYGPRQEERELVSLGEIPPLLLQAILAAEDARFYDHHGLDLRAVVRAGWANLRRGRIVQGGSTISQQVVKNLFLDSRRTWWRKLREAALAVALDLRFDKDRILEVYVNEVYLGQQGTVAICGIQAASRFYFGRPVQELSLAEWATLAGMIRSPGAYDPRRHPDRAAQRRRQVLDAMVRLGFVDPETAEAAAAAPCRVAPGGRPAARAPFLVDLIRRQLADTFDAGDLAQAGLQIYTSVDARVQLAAEAALKEGLERLEREHPFVRRQRAQRRLEGAVVVTRPRTGEILALVGGRDYARSQFNRALDARRQPGSCFKPFVYLAGFEAALEGRGLTPATILQDEPIRWASGGQVWQPTNYDGRFRGPVTVRQALQDSLNVPTVQAARQVGLRPIAELAERCGFPRFRPLPSLALGAQEATPLQVATAYGVLASLGIRSDPRVILEVRDRSGVRVEGRPDRRARVCSPQAAFLVTDILQGVMREGTARSAARYGFRGVAAGKTGTTDGTRDAWFAGYTPDVLAVVWVGYDDGHATGLTGATGALPIWADLMERAGLHEGRTFFPQPDGVVYTWVDPATGARATRLCPERVAEVFIEGTEPDEDCPLHRRGRLRRWWSRFRRGAL